jgi:acyl carrier protein phosphodiesterase
MNLLAHALLIPKRGDIRMGNVLADFLSTSEIREQSADFQKGVKYHYQVDRVTDEFSAPLVPLIQPAVGSLFDPQMEPLHAGRRAPAVY